MNLPIFVELTRLEIVPPLFECDEHCSKVLAHKGVFGLLVDRKFSDDSNAELLLFGLGKYCSSQDWTLTNLVHAVFSTFRKVDCARTHRAYLLGYSDLFRVDDRNSSLLNWLWFIVR